MVVPLGTRILADNISSAEIRCEKSNIATLNVSIHTFNPDGPSALRPLSIQQMLGIGVQIAFGTAITNFCLVSGLVSPGLGCNTLL